MLNPLEKSIVRTIAYFDMYDYPLTATEVWQYLYKPDVPESERQLDDVVQALASRSRLSAILSRVEGFYCLKGREDIIPIRKRRNLRVDRQMKKTERILKLLRMFPAIRMVAIASSLSLGNVKRSSDIDLFIVAKKNQIWLSRFLAAGMLKMLGQRPDTDTTRDRFCLTFFVTEDSLNIERAAFGIDDIVFHYYVQSFSPLYDPDNLFEKFIDANTWLNRYIPNALTMNGRINQVSRPKALKAWHSFFEKATWPVFYGPFQSWYCNMQLKILPDNLKELANVDSRVIVSNTMLKFHDKDNRHLLQKRWQDVVKTYE